MIVGGVIWSCLICELPMTQNICCQCGAHGQTNLYGYIFCDRCESKLGLHSDATILKNAESYQQSKPISYEDEVVRRLQIMEKDFAKRKVKLLHILERLSELR
jgi:hypothetical protein